MNRILQTRPESTGNHPSHAENGASPTSGRPATSATPGAERPATSGVERSEATDSRPATRDSRSSSDDRPSSSGRWPFPGVRVLALVLGALLVGGVGAAPQDEAVRRAVDEGYADLVAGRYPQALDRFEFLSRGAADTGEVSFFRGVALSRMGEHAEGLVWLDRARDMGYTNANLSLERGICLVERRLFADAVPALDRAVAESPTSAAHLYRGRALFGVERFGEARRAFEESVSIDPSTRDVADVFLAMIDRRTRPGSASSDEVLQAFDRLQRRPSAQGHAGSPAPMAGGRSASNRKRTRGGVSLGVGFNDNVVAVADGVALPTDISNRSAGFRNTGVYVVHQLSPGTAEVEEDEDQLILSYQLQSNDYEGVDTADLDDHSLGLSWTRPLDPRLDLEVTLANQYTVLDDDGFRNQARLRVGLDYDLGREWGLASGVMFSQEGYLTPTTVAGNRDGETDGVDLTLRYDRGSGRTQASLGFAHSESRTDGTDFDRTSDAIVGTVRTRIGDVTEASLLASYSSDRYPELNTFSGLTSSREDDVTVIRLQVSRSFKTDFADSSQAYLRFDEVSNHSNLLPFRYDQSTVAAGVSFGF